MVVMKNCQLFLKFSKRENRLDKFFFSDIGGLSHYLKLSKVIKKILVLFHGQGCVERGLNVNKDMLQPNLEGTSLMSQRIIYDHLVSNELYPQSTAITKELRDSVHKANSRQRQRIDLAERKEKEASDAGAGKAETLTKDINKLNSKKDTLEKLEETLKSYSESLMLKAPEDTTKAHAYAIEAKSIMYEHKQKVLEIEKLTDTISSPKKKHKEF